MHFSINLLLRENLSYFIMNSIHGIEKNINNNKIGVNQGKVNNIDLNSDIQIISKYVQHLANSQIYYAFHIYLTITIHNFYLR